MSTLGAISSLFTASSLATSSEYVHHVYLQQTLVMHYADFEAIEKFLSAETIEYMVEYAVTAYRIHVFFRGLASFDMHSGNWMINDAGLPIITDPVSFSRGASDGE